MLLSPAYAPFPLHAAVHRAHYRAQSVSHPLIQVGEHQSPGSGGSFWGKFKPKGKDEEPQMAIARQRLLTLCYDEMETIRMVCGLPLVLQISL